MFFFKENINTKDYIMVAQSITICPLQIYSEPRLTFCRYQSINNKISAIASRGINISNFCQSSNELSCEYEDFSVAQFIRFLKHIKLKKLLSKINDPRQKKKIKYSNDVILQWALAVYFFKRGSKNALQTALEKLKPLKRAAILNYLGLEERGSSLPHRTVVNDYLTLVNPDEINELLIYLFNWAKKNKIFYNHMETLLPNGRFHIACDGFCVHKYTSPHAVNEKGENICPYCLPRTRNKGKENEMTYWIHGFVNVAITFPGGLQLPLYVYPLKAAQIHLEASVSDDVHKQECELQAAQIILPILKEKLGKLPVTLLTDSLYANEPLIQLCEKPSWEYLIVRQEGSLKTVRRKCNELEQSELYQKSYEAKKTIKLKNGGTIERTVKWFNRVTVGKESYTRLLALLKFSCIISLLLAMRTGVEKIFRARIIEV
jgi:hypothetical protein